MDQFEQRNIDSRDKIRLVENGLKNDYYVSSNKQRIIAYCVSPWSVGEVSVRCEWLVWRPLGDQVGDWCGQFILEIWNRLRKLQGYWVAIRATMFAAISIGVFATNMHENC